MNRPLKENATMIRATVFLRLCYLTAVSFAGAVISYGQPHEDRLDYGTSEQEAINIEDANHAAWYAHFNKEFADAKTEYRLGELHCRAGMTPLDNNAACYKAIILKYQARTREICAERVQEDGDHEKHLIDIHLHYHKPRRETATLPGPGRT
jgi:hypothetical protein